MKEFFKDKDGQYSMMRLLSFILVISGVLCAFITKEAGLTATLLGFGITGKAVQAFKK